MAEAQGELESQLVEVGNRLASPPSNVDELLSLLDQAKIFLSRVEQAPSESTSSALYPAMKALVSKELLSHSEMDVKISLASCFSEITRITAPDDPYDGDLLKDIFQMIVAVFENLDDLSSRSYCKRVSILETIAKVRSCVVLLDLECNDLILDMFQHFLKTIRPGHTRNVFSSMETIMTLVLKESKDISSELLSCLLESMEKDNTNILPIARRLGEKVIANCAGKLKPNLVELVQAKGTYSNFYTDTVASICQEDSDTLEPNELSVSAECSADDSKLSDRTMSDGLPQDSGSLKNEVASPEENGTPADKSSTLVLSNGTGNHDSMIRTRSLRLNPERNGGNGQSKSASAAAIAELVDLNSSIVVKPDSLSDHSIKQRRDDKGDSLIHLGYTTSCSQNNGDKALLVPHRRRGRSREVGGLSGIKADRSLCLDTEKSSELEPSGQKGASDNDQNEGERLPSEDREYKKEDKIIGNSIRRSLRQSRKSLHHEVIGDETSKTKHVDVPLKEVDETIDSEVNNLCLSSRRRSTRNVIGRESSGQKKSRIEQLTVKNVVEKNLAREQSLKDDGKTKLVDIPLKEAVETIDSEEKNLCLTSRRRSTRKLTLRESSGYKESKIEQLMGEIIIKKDLAGKKSSKKLIPSPKYLEAQNKDQYHLDESSGTNSKIKHARGAEENREKELDGALVGSEIKVWWPDDKMFYEGVIDSFDPISKKHKVLYFDGDEETLLLKDERWKFLKDNRKTDCGQGKEIPGPDASPEIGGRPMSRFRAYGTRFGGQKGSQKLGSRRIDEMFENFKRKARDRRKYNEQSVGTSSLGIGEPGDQSEDDVAEPSSTFKDSTNPKRRRVSNIVH